MTNIAATGAKNAADLLTVSGVTDTNASNISTNTSNISTNTTNIAATGAKNAADILTVSGLTGASAAGSDTYVQFNDGGTDFGGESEFTYTKAGSGILKVGTIVTNDADAARIGVVSIGSGSYARSDYAVAIGVNTDVGENGVAIGRGSTVTSDYAGIAIGQSNDSVGRNAIVIGTSSLAEANDSIAIGNNADSEAFGGIAIGAQCVARTSEGIAIGYKSYARGERSIALGEEAGWAGPNNDGYDVSIGYQANAPTSGLVISAGSNNAILSGQFNDTAAATNGYLLTSTKFGINRTSKPDAMLDVTSFAATDVGAIIQGAASQTADLTQWQNSAGTTLASMGMTTANDATALLLGSGSIVSNEDDYNRSLAGGMYYGGNLISIGSGSRAAADNTIAIGTVAYADGAYGVALGWGCETRAGASYGVSIGFDSWVQGNLGISIGRSSYASQETVAIGYGAGNVSHTASTRSVFINVAQSLADSAYSCVAIGYSSRAGGPYSVSLGHATNSSNSAHNGYDVCIGNYAESDAYAIAIGYQANAPTSGLVIGAGSNNHILSGQFNDTFDAVNGHLNILGDSLKVSGNGQVRVNDSYTFPTAVAGGSDYVLTAQTDGSTAWAAAAGGSAAGSDTYVQFNDGGSSFGGESEFTYAKAGSGILKVGTIVTNDADAARIGAVSIGSGATVDGDYSVAIGDRAKVEGGGGGTAVAIGSRADAYDASVAIGCTATANTHVYSIAIGNEADANARYATAVGKSAHAGTESVAMGINADASYSYGVAIGKAAKMKATHGVAIGYEAEAYDSAVAVGLLAKTLGTNAIAIGGRVVAPTSGLVIGAAADNSILSGQFNDTAAATNGYLLTSTKFGINRTSKPDAMLDVTSFTNTDVGVIVQGAASQTADLTQWQDSAGTTLASIAPSLNTTDRMTLMVSGTIVSNPSDADRIGVVSIGSGAYCTSNSSVAIGSLAQSVGAAAGATAVGSSAKANGSNVAIGYGAQATSDSTAVAIGANAIANDEKTVAIGKAAQAVNGGTSIGSSAALSNPQNHTICIGESSSATATSSTVVGNDGLSAGVYGIALGNNAGALGEYAIAIGRQAKAPTSGLVIGAGSNNHILSGQFNDTFDAVNGHLNILGDSLKVSGNGQVRVNDSYTFPTAVAGGSDYVLTAQTDGSTAWAAAAGGSAAGSDTYVQFNDGGSSFGGESEFTYTKAGSGILKVGTIVTNDADADRPGTVVIGSGAVAGYDNSIVIGRDAKAGHADSVSIGRNAHGTAIWGDKNVAIGYNAQAYSQGVAIGYGAVTFGTNGVGIGTSAWGGYRGVAIGGQNGFWNSDGVKYGVAIGYSAQNIGAGNSYESMVAIGYHSEVYGDYGVAIGRESKGSDYSVSLGYKATAPTSGLVIGAAGDNSILSGQFNDTAAATNGYLLTSTRFGINRTSKPDAMLDVTSFANTDVGVIVQGAASQSADLMQWQDSAGTTLASIAPSLNTTDRMTLMVSGTIVSNPSDADRIGVVSIGSGAYAMGDNATAIGHTAKVAATSVGVGANANATATYATAVGSSSNATGGLSVAIGYSSYATDSKSIGIGYLATCNAERSIVIGDSSSDNSNSYSTVMGYYANAYGSNSVALGASTEAGEFSVTVGPSAGIDADYAISIGNYAEAPTSGLVIGAGSNNHILSGQFNDTFDAVNGHLNILGDSLKVSGNGQVRVNDSYTFPTAVAGGSDYVLTAQTDGSTAWAAAAAGGPAGSDTYVQFNDGGSSFGGETRFKYDKVGSGILYIDGVVQTSRGTRGTYSANDMFTSSMALGSGAYTNSRFCVALGNDAVAGYAGGDGFAVAVGNGAQATHLYCTAIGYNASSTDAGDTAIGYESEAYGGSVALGMDTIAKYDSTVLGRSAGMATNARHVTSVGYATQNLQSAHESYSYRMVSLGYQAKAKGNESIAIGGNSNASEEQSIAIGGYVIAPRSGMVIGAAADNSILSGQFNDTAVATNGYLLTSTRFGINRTSKPDAMLDVTSFTNTDVGAIIQGAASQTADLQQWQDSAGTTLASIAPSSKHYRSHDLDGQRHDCL